MKITDHRDRHRPLTRLCPLQTGVERRGEPPADPLHGSGESQSLGIEQPPGPAGVGCIDDDGAIGTDRSLQALQHQRAHLIPGSLHRRVTEQLSADRISGEHQRCCAILCSQQRRQLMGHRCFSTTGSADQQVTAQGCFGHPGNLTGVRPEGKSLARTTTSLNRMRLSFAGAASR